MKIKILTLFILLSACSDGLNMSPPSPDLFQNTGASPASTLVVFQGGIDVAAQNPVYIDVPLPTRPIEARLYLYGHLLTTLFYTEMPRHTPTAQPGYTSLFEEDHTHGILTGFTGAGSFNGLTSFWGSSGCPIPDGGGQYYRRLTETNAGCLETGGLPVLQTHRSTHSHLISLNMDPLGVEGFDEAMIPLQVSTQQKTYPNDLRIFLNTEDITAVFASEMLGSGSADDDLVRKGVGADLNEYFQESGHYRIGFYVGGNGSQSLGGRINYVLWLRVENTAFANLDDSGSEA